MLFWGRDRVFWCLVLTLLAPLLASSYPYGEYGAFTRTRRDPASWNRGYRVQQNQMPIVPDSRLGSYGSTMDSRGGRLGGSYGVQHDPNMYGVNQYGQGKLKNSHSNSMLSHRDSSIPNSAGTVHGDLSSYQQGPQQQYPNQLSMAGGLGEMGSLPEGWDSGAPNDCQGVTCESLLNCINVTVNDTKCCPECIQYGCVCEGYQIYDCQANGFKDGMVPGGKSYTVAEGTTICSCPPEGGSIMCSFQDPSSSECPELTPNCISSFKRELDGCEECSRVGCTTRTGEKIEAGVTIDVPPCSTCHCLPQGGEPFCVDRDPCIPNLQSGGSDSLALEGSMRELGQGGTEQNAQENLGYGFTGNRYPDYGGQYGNGGGPVIPPVMPPSGSQDISSLGVDREQGTTFDSSKTDLGTGMNSFGYPEEFGNMGYPNHFGYGGNEWGYGRMNGVYGPPYNGVYDQGLEYQQPGIGGRKNADESIPDDQNTDNGEDSRKTGVQESDKGTQEISQAGQGVEGHYQQASLYPYYSQSESTGYGEFSQQRYVPPLMGAYPGPYGNQEYGKGALESSQRTDEEASKDSSGLLLASRGKTEEGQDDQQRPEASPNLGYPYGGYSQEEYFQPYPFQGLYPVQPSSPEIGVGGDELGKKSHDDSSSMSKENKNTHGLDGQLQQGYKPYLGGYDQLGYPNQFGNFGQNLGIGGVDSSDSTDREGTDKASKSESAPPKDPTSLRGLNLPHYPYDQKNQFTSHNFRLKQPGSEYFEPAKSGPVNSAEEDSLSKGLPESSQKETKIPKDISTTGRLNNRQFDLSKNRHSHVKAHPTPPPTSTTSTPVTEKLRVKSAKQATYENVLMRCCSNGRQWALSHDSCTGISVTVPSYSEICAAVQEKCCLEGKENQYCQGGIDTARSMAACDVPANLGGTCGGNEFQTCCDCCAMGLKALGLGMHCDTDVKIFGEPCNRAYVECCQSGTVTPRAPSSPETKETRVSRGRLRPSTEPPGPHCSTDSECQQICDDTPSGMVCSCHEGYQIHENEKDCEDINECVLNTHNCNEHEFCLNNVGSFTCQRRISCGTGYELTDRNTCEDIDECGLGIHDCFGNMDCENIRGSYRCIPKLCDEGFFTDATGRCIDIDECRAGDYLCPKGASCVNTDGGYECRCPTGFEVDAAKESCQDIDECSTGTANCADGSTCINTKGSFVCRDPPRLRCSPGYQPNEGVTACIDIDECAEGTHTCMAGSTCINGEGGFRCQDPLVCPEGLRPDEKQLVCLDIDECKDPSKHRCDTGGRCQNTHKSFHCVCDSGYVNAVMDDGVPNCVDVDECAGPAGKTCKYRCRNLPGSYECICPTGYKLSSFGSKCDDIDECAATTNPCSEAETCFNTFGGHRCVALTCPTGYNKISNKRCQRKSCRILRTKGCTKLPKQISFHNITLSNGTNAEKPLFRMSLARSHATDRYEFLITDGNRNGNFKVKSSSRIKRPTGVVYTATELTGPGDYTIDLSLKLNRNHRLSTFVSRLYIFVSEYDL